MSPLCYVLFTLPLQRFRTVSWGLPATCRQQLLLLLLLFLLPLCVRACVRVTVCVYPPGNGWYEYYLI